MVKHFFLVILLNFFATIGMEKIYIFSSKSNIQQWRVVNDGVMGGISKSSLALTEEGFGQFSGYVSLANNGGFASIQLNTKIKLSEQIKYIILKVKGDGKRYEFRLKGEVSQFESYVHPFTTSTNWDIIKLPINEFYPQFRGQKLKIPNFNFSNIEQLSFLIANKQEESFQLLIDWIALE